MALTCPLDLDVTRPRAEVQSMYARLAAEPGVIGVNIAANKW